MQKCSVLMQLDYSVVELSNITGELSSHYPSQILIPDLEKQRDVGLKMETQSHTIHEQYVDPVKLRDLISKARFAR